MTRAEGDRSLACTVVPGELLLVLFGRRGAAEVEIAGPPEALEALRRTPFGR